MIKTLNDLLSIVFIIIICYLTIKISLGSLINANKETATGSTRRKILINYTDNEDE